MLEVYNENMKNVFSNFFGGGGRSSNWSDLVATSRKFGNSTRIVVSQVFWEKTFSRGVYKSIQKLWSWLCHGNLWPTENRQASISPLPSASTPSTTASRSMRGRRRWAFASWSIVHPRASATPRARGGSFFQTALLICKQQIWPPTNGLRARKKAKEIDWHREPLSQHCKLQTV